MTIELDFDLGDYAVLLHDTTKSKRMIISVSTSIHGGSRVELAHGMDTSWHFVQEIEVIKDSKRPMGFK
jgi:hypothetical protein